MCFVDNTGAQAVATNGFASTLDCAVIASLIWSQVAVLDAAFWVERVDSESNIADCPTRMGDPACRLLLAGLCCREVPAVFPEREIVRLLSSRAGGR